MANCAVGSCHSQGKEMGQSQGLERYSQLEIRRKLDSNVMPEVGVVICVCTTPFISFNHSCLLPKSGIIQSCLLTFLLTV